jgi:hypothetical protein
MLGNIVAGCFGLAHVSLLQVAGESQCSLDVGGLRALVATGKQNDYRSPPRREVHPVTRAIINSQFRYTFTHWFYISRVPSSQSFDTSQNAPACMNVAKTIKPSGISIGFANFFHRFIVAVWLQIVNTFHPRSGYLGFFMVGMKK